MVARGGQVTKLRATVRWWLRRALDIGFDTLHGVDTGAVIRAGTQNPAKPHLNVELPHAYDPSPWRIVSRCLRLAGITTCSDFTFVDIGCGKGKVLLSATVLPFSKVIGVEFSPHLCEVAQRNIRAARLLRRRCTNTEIVCCDASYWSPPSDGPLLCFFANPFNSTVMKKVLSNIV